MITATERQGLSWALALFSVTASLCGAPERGLAAPQTCTASALDGFIEQAQRGVAAALPRGQSLRGCPTLSAEATQWLAFLTAWTGDRAGSLKLDELPTVLPPLKGLTQPSVLARARHGDYRELWGKVDNRARGYTADAAGAEAVLVLARVLARKTFFNRSRDLYVTYLRIRPGDHRVEAEYLYTFLWERQAAAAEARLLSAGRRSPSSPLAGAVERGLELCRTLPGGSSASMAAPAKTPPPPSRPPTPVAVAPSPPAPPAPAASARLGRLRGGASVVELPHSYLRRTLAVAYDGWLDARLGAHQLELGALAPRRLVVTEAVLGFTAVAGPVRLAAHGGYFSAGDGGYLGDAAAAGTVASRWQWQLGLTRTPLLAERPLPEDDVAMTLDEARAALDYGRFVSITTSLRREGEYPAYERHTLTARLPLRGEASRPAPALLPPVALAGTWLALRLPLLLEIRPRPHPDYDAPARTQLLSCGVEWEQRLSRRLAVSTATDYGVAKLDGRGAASIARTVALGRLTVGLDLTVAAGDGAASKGSGSGGTGTVITLSGHGAWAEETDVLRTLAWTRGVELSASHFLP